MTEFKLDDKVRTTQRVSSDIPAGAVARVVRATPAGAGDVAVVFDNPIGIYRGPDGLSTLADGFIQFHCWLSKTSLELVAEPLETSGEKMIPASKVREIAKLYAARHGWCDVVNNALREMGAEDDTMVDVTITQTRTIRMRTSDVSKLRTEEQLKDLQDDSRRIRYVFSNDQVPADSSLVQFSYEFSEPVEVKEETDWVSLVGRNLRGDEVVRFTPGTPRETYNGRSVPEDVTVRLASTRPDSDGDMRVRFSTPLLGIHEYGYVSRDKLQIHRPQG